MKLSPSEALFAFCGWLTSRKQVTEMGSTKDAAIVADLVKEFCQKYNLEEPREHWKECIKKSN